MLPLPQKLALTSLPPFFLLTFLLGIHVQSYRSYQGSYVYMPPDFSCPSGVSRKTRLQINLRKFRKIRDIMQLLTGSQP